MRAEPAGRDLGRDPGGVTVLNRPQPVAITPRRRRRTRAAIAGPYGKVVCRLPPRASVTAAWVTRIVRGACTRLFAQTATV